MSAREGRELELTERVVRLFPLPGVVHFPHAVLPLHLFEPRYRQLLRDAAASDHLIAMIQQRPTRCAGDAEPPLERVGCLGKILKLERLADGRFNLLLLGLRRFRLVRELPAPTLYRQAEARLIEDREDAGAESHRESLIRLFLRFQSRRGPVDRDLANFLGSGAELGAVADLIAHALGLPAPVAQILLDEPCVGKRVGLLLEILARSLDDPLEGGPPMPPWPPFSDN